MEETVVVAMLALAGGEVEEPIVREPPKNFLRWMW
jgi:hypothetical protein